MKRLVLASLLAAVAGVGIIIVSATWIVSSHSSSARAALVPPPTATARPAGSLSPRTVLSAAIPPPVPTPMVAGETQFLTWPADGYVTQGMTPNHPTGIDIAASLGSEIRAARDGVVYFAGGDPCCSYGYYIVIGHDQGWVTVYGHLSTFLVKVGDQVKQGQVIALSGDTGHVTGPHLHFELRSYGRPVNPLDYLFPARFVEVDAATPQDVITTPEDVSVPPVVSSEQAAAPGSVPDPTETPTPSPPAGLGADQATALAIDWMAHNQTAAYTIDPSTCHAIQFGTNWIVTCAGTLDGCSGNGPCSSYLSACVPAQSGVITPFCP